ncbi:MAG: hypothetical protein QOE11_1650 [Solirubrobacteraceae bacterium]|nr:hypothetical protein [Solirubrobacteraceae bacterium]
MLGRKTYTQEELDNARATVDRQLVAYKRLREAADGAAAEALDAFEPLFFNNMILALDRLFVHRLRSVTGKDANPLNEVELLTESLMNNGGVLRGNNVIKLVPGETVLRLNVGDQIALDADQFERLSDAFLADIESKYV